MNILNRELVIPLNNKKKLYERIFKRRCKAISNGSYVRNVYISYMVKKQTLTEEIEEAIEIYKNAMFDNVKASKAVVDAQDKKQKSHHAMMKASERLHALQVELMQNVGWNK